MNIPDSELANTNHLKDQFLKFPIHLLNCKKTSYALIPGIVHLAPFDHMLIIKSL